MSVFRVSRHFGNFERAQSWTHLALIIGIFLFVQSATLSFKSISRAGEKKALSRGSAKVGVTWRTLHNQTSRRTSWVANNQARPNQSFTNRFRRVCRKLSLPASSVAISREVAHHFRHSTRVAFLKKGRNYPCQRVVITYSAVRCIKLIRHSEYREVINYCLVPFFFQEYSKSSFYSFFRKIFFK